MLKGGDDIRYKIEPGDQYHEVTVIGNAAKLGSKAGANKNLYNVMSNDYKQSSVFVDRVSDLEKKTTNINYTNMLMCKEEEEGVFFSEKPTKECLEKVEEAKLCEINNFKKFQVYEEVPLEDCPNQDEIISSIWIIQRKDGGRVKARLCARGFQEVETYKHTDAPTADKTSIRVFLTIVGMLGWQSGSLDVKSAFLQSHRLDRSVYMLPPKDIRKNGMVWKITKPIYGLRDSVQNWYNTLKHDLISVGCEQSILDPTVFRFYEGNSLKGLFLCHVDDFLFSIGDTEFTDKVINRLKDRYEISSENMGSFDFVGLSRTWMVSHWTKNVTSNQFHQ